MRSFYLEKQAFWKTMYLMVQHTTSLRNIPSHCVYGKAFSLEHALSCPKLALDTMSYKILLLNYLMNATQM